MGNEQIAEIRQRLQEALDLLADMESGQAPAQRPQADGTDDVYSLFERFGFLSGSAMKNANTFRFLGAEYIKRAMAYVRTNFPHAPINEKHARLIACLRDRYTLQAVPDEAKEQAEHEARLEELRRKREAKEKARVQG